MTKTYNEILQFIVDKYKGVFTSLYTINDDTFIFMIPMDAKVFDLSAGNVQ